MRTMTKLKRRTHTHAHTYIFTTNKRTDRALLSQDQA